MQTHGGPVKFTRQDHFPEGWEICVAQFLELFHRHGYIYKPLSGGSWYSANESWKLTDSEILKAIACAHPKFFVGCRAAKSTRFALLDIDQNSRYHNRRSLEKLLQILSQAGLTRSSLYRSSYSGGWHIYIFFEEQINSADLRRQLVKLLTLNDFHMAKGQLEIFPHPGGKGSLGLGLRLPLQPGFAWLDKKTLEVEYERHELTATEALELFIDMLDGDANSYTDFRHLKTYVHELEQRRTTLAVQVAGAPGTNVIPFRRAEAAPGQGEFINFVRTVFQQLPPGIIIDNWYKGRLYHLNGLTGPSQRAEAIECIGHYLFYGDPSRDLPPLGYGYEKEREWSIREFLLVRHNGQSKDLNRGRADALAQVERAANWRPPHKQINEPQKYSPQRPVSWIRENINRKVNARKRISDALDGLKKLRRSFTTVELQEAAGCSRRTLYSHADIWRKDYEDLAVGFFAICTDEYNVVVGAGLQETKPPTTSLEQAMPPERLAARCVAYEISRRAGREKIERHKAIVKLREASEKTWRANVTRLTEKDPSVLSIMEVKALLTVLFAYLATAPSEEDLLLIQSHIERIKTCFSNASKKALYVVRPP